MLAVHNCERMRLTIYAPENTHLILFAVLKSVEEMWERRAGIDGDGRVHRDRKCYWCELIWETSNK